MANSESSQVSCALRLAVLGALLFTISVKATPLEPPLSSERVRDYVTANPAAQNKVEFLKQLPDEYRENYIMMIDSESNQAASCEEPRVLLQGRNSDPIFGMTTTKTGNKYSEAGFEMMKFDSEKKKFDFNAVHPGQTPPFVHRDKTCNSCHGDNPRPNWDAYDSWPNMIPFNRDRIYQGSEEEKAYKRIWEKMADDPIMSQLKLPDGVTRTEIGKDANGKKRYRVDIDYAGKGKTDTETTVEVTLSNGEKKKITKGGTYLMIGHPNKGGVGGSEGQGIAMFDQLTSLNAQRVAGEIRNSPAFDKFKFAFAAILNGCVSSAADLASYLPAEDVRTRERIINMKISEAIDATAEARRRLPTDKMTKMKAHLTKLIECNAKANPPTPPYTRIKIEEMVLQELMRRNPTGFSTDATGQVVDRETHSETIPNYLRALLEGERGIRASKWSMSVKTRSSTFTFADLFGQYRSAMSSLVNDLGSDCANLKTKSLEAYNNARGTPRTREPRPTVSPETPEEGKGLENH